MQKEHSLEFDCQDCQQPIRFSIFELDGRDSLISCSQCKKKYAFHDEALKRQIKKFEALCRQIIDSEEILSHTSVGVDIGDNHIKVPYRLLLTRLNSVLDLKIGDQPLAINFRIEPLRDYPRIKKEG